MSKRFGKARVPGCECTERFTCSPCLRAAPPYFFTPSEQPDALVKIDGNPYVLDLKTTEPSCAK